MEKVLKYLAEQNKYFDPKDSLSKLVSQVLRDAESELDEDDLSSVQAARGAEAQKPADQWKEPGQI